MSGTTTPPAQKNSREPGHPKQASRRRTAATCRLSHSFQSYARSLTATEASGSTY